MVSAWRLPPLDSSSVSCHGSLGTRCRWSMRLPPLLFPAILFPQGAVSLPVLHAVTFKASSSVIVTWIVMTATTSGAPSLVRHMARGWTEGCSLASITPALRRCRFEPARLSPRVLLLSPSSFPILLILFVFYANVSTHFHPKRNLH